MNYSEIEKKYELTDETIKVGGRTLHRIRALRAFKDVDVGELGGYIESETNLSQDGNCWVFGDARVYGNAKVYGNVWVFGKAWVFGNAEIFGNAEVYGDALVSGDAQVYDDAEIFSNAEIFGNAEVYGDALVSGDAQVYDDAWICGNARVSANARVCGDALIKSNGDYVTDKGYGRVKGTTTAFRCTNGGIKVTSGCFKGTLDEFSEHVEFVYGDKKYGQEYKLLIELWKLHFKEGK